MFNIRVRQCYCVVLYYHAITKKIVKIKLHGEFINSNTCLLKKICRFKV